MAYSMVQAVTDYRAIFPSARPTVNRPTRDLLFEEGEESKTPRILPEARRRADDIRRSRLIVRLEPPNWPTDGASSGADSLDNACSIWESILSRTTYTRKWFSVISRKAERLRGQTRLAMLKLRSVSCAFSRVIPCPVYYRLPILSDIAITLRMYGALYVCSAR
ncbi:hypothetical protein MYCTH_2106732 [Thermothelomyces thermophilus ATCC 42464]|uniref:Uncharacterized protein n=1 Tax=Thermothelomyces thermophilus (strain ATCC 42464 / BCRC 31852 / DSM 1799) TaxID=573729 RepID=G2Q6X5_THET4|nr:uncharacterized protein MYCTH_2106732 [Thermothelomyces thermophilus ATCC 42464]AEO53953.1 hypothetical protein MYCTH_2106732 [Thermothelomyces thermophilus ATCC 42464]